MRIQLNNSAVFIKQLKSSVDLIEIFTHKKISLDNLSYFSKED